MSGDEYNMYLSICKSYEDGNNKGSDLFVDLFETDEEGIILFLRPPSKRGTTMEAFLFLVSLMTQQHLRINYLQIEDLSNQVKNKLNEIGSRLSKLESKAAEAAPSSIIKKQK